MKLIQKTDLEFVEGYLLDSATGEIVDLSAVATELNEVVEIRDFTAFLKANEADILASKDRKPIVYRAPKPEAPVMKTSRVASTPLLDEAKDRAEAVALEFINASAVDRFYAHLQRYVALAKFFVTDVFPHATSSTLPVKFEANPLDFTEADVVAIIEEFHEPAVEKLVGLVRVER